MTHEILQMQRGTAVRASAFLRAENEAAERRMEKEKQR